MRTRQPFVLFIIDYFIDFFYIFHFVYGKFVFQIFSPSVYNQIGEKLCAFLKNSVRCCV